MNEDDYRKDLARRQQEHLKNVRANRFLNFRPCMNDECPQCIGTGIKQDGTKCLHMMSCPCQKCSPFTFQASGTGSVVLRNSISIEPAGERPMRQESTNDLTECWPQ
jgi:hypothetical protein